jgi:hypothetical protein
VTGPAADGPLSGSNPSHKSSKHRDSVSGRSGNGNKQNPGPPESIPGLGG